MCNVRVSLAILCLLGLSACAAAPNAGTQFDGTYVGANTLTRGTGAAWVCGPDTAPGLVTVGAGDFNYVVPITGPTPVVVHVRLHGDGSFSGSTEYFEVESGLFRGPLAWVTVVGHVTGTAMDAQVDTLNCGRHLSLQRG
jgi:hypothetical protein